MTSFRKIQDQLKSKPKTWLITGVAGFIGSNLLEELLKLNQNVVGLDNFSTGYKKNLDEVKSLVSQKQWKNFTFIDGDIRNSESCMSACSNIDIILHQAALGSVPRSIEDPILTNSTNIDGFLNIINAARVSGVERFVYAASSSTYGDHIDLPKRESVIGAPLSPYAVTKLANELYADVFSKCYGLSSIGLRYFNIFGRRQDPNGAYAAVIPKFISALIQNKSVTINGDGKTSRDFCYVDNAVQANILAGVTQSELATNQIYNIAVGEQTSLNELFNEIKCQLTNLNLGIKEIQPNYGDFRDGDVRHSLADIKKANQLLGYFPEFNVKEGLAEAISWYISNH
tara:strand:+ start:2065 stop:3090 length:1026 start_codon:yes stop_codon:yes gene_type:complete